MLVELHGTAGTNMSQIGFTHMDLDLLSQDATDRLYMHGCLQHVRSIRHMHLNAKLYQTRCVLAKKRHWCEYNLRTPPGVVNF